MSNGKIVAEANTTPPEAREKRKKKDKKKKVEKKNKNKKLEKEVDENISEAGKSEDDGVDRNSETEEAEFWMPPVGERWDFDDGGDRWGSGSDLECDTDEVTGTGMLCPNQVGTCNHNFFFLLYDHQEHIMY